MPAKAPPGIQVGRGACGPPSAARLPLLKHGPLGRHSLGPRVPHASGRLVGLSAREPLPAVSWGPRGPFSSLGPPCEVSVVWRGCYLARQLVRLHGLYLKVAGRLKIEGFRWAGPVSAARFPWQRRALAHFHPH